jgi:hypothetical protein
MTLIEVMMAITILVIGVFAMVQASSNCLAVAKRSQQFTQARQVMDQGILEHPLIKTNQVEDMVLPPVKYENGFVFSRDVVESEEDYDLYIVKTRVEWPNKGTSKALELYSYLYTTNHPPVKE